MDGFMHTTTSIPNFSHCLAESTSAATSRAARTFRRLTAINPAPRGLFISRFPLEAAMAENMTPAPFNLLAADHDGMRVDYRGLMRQSQHALKHSSPGHAEMLRQFEGHLTELGTRWYAGDTAVVDEILQLYCIEHEARQAVAARPASPVPPVGAELVSDAGRLAYVADQIRALEPAGSESDVFLTEASQVLRSCAEALATTDAPHDTVQALRALHDSVELAMKRGALSERALEIIVMQPATDVLIRADEATPAAPAEGIPCGVCGADDAFTGSCGGGRTNPRALCFERATLSIKPAADHIADSGKMVSTGAAGEREAFEKWFKEARKAELEIPNGPPLYDEMRLLWEAWSARAALATTQMPVCDSVQTEASSKPASTASEIAAAICQRVAELDDRNSPEGQPNMMLVTRGELHGFICEALATTPDADQADCLKNFRAILNAEINRAIDPSGDIARQEAAIDTTDHLLAEFSKLFPEA